MRAEFLDEGKKFQFTATAAIAYHDLVITNDLVGVANAAAVVGETIVCEAKGVFTMPKDTGITFEQGAKVYYNTTSGKITATSTDTLIGIAWIAAATADTSVAVRIG